MQGMGLTLRLAIGEFYTDAKAQDGGRGFLGAEQGICRAKTAWSPKHFCGGLI